MPATATRPTFTHNRAALAERIQAAPRCECCGKPLGRTDGKVCLACVRRVRRALAQAREDWMGGDR